MKRPWKFQTFDRELSPVLKYLRGKVLNAGCGDRDVADLLIENNAASVDNVDIKSSLPDAIICEITDIPREDNYYDSILCNAVLEHVPAPVRVLKELYRLLKPGGFLVGSVPFLQPYHPNPGDYYRFTREGLAELARLTGFEVVQINPVHSLAQTVTWIVWEHLGDKRIRYMKALLWLPLYLWNLLSQRTDPGSIKSANTYQFVFKK